MSANANARWQLDSRQWLSDDRQSPLVVVVDRQTNVDHDVDHQE